MFFGIHDRMVREKNEHRLWFGSHIKRLYVVMCDQSKPFVLSRHNDSLYQQSRKWWPLYSHGCPYMPWRIRDSLYGTRTAKRTTTTGGAHSLLRLRISQCLASGSGDVYGYTAVILLIAKHKCTKTRQKELGSDSACAAVRTSVTITKTKGARVLAPHLSNVYVSSKNK